MGKDYLNKEEQQLLWMMGAMNYTCQDKVDELEEHAPHKKDLIKYLKYLRTYSDKVMTNLTEGLSKELLDEYVGKLKRREVSMLVSETSMEMKMRNLDEPVVIDEEQFFDLVDVVLSKECHDCDQDEKCGLRDVFIKNDVPFFDGQDDVCPYRQNY